MRCARCSISKAGCATGSSGAAGARAARTLERIELFDPPAPPALSGLSFLEFGVDEAAGRALGTLFEQLGFRHAGRHRSKAVTLYRQGDINLIINAQPNSAARARFDEMGPSVCAIGLRTEDAVRSVNRATALQSARYDSPLGANEASVPAVRSPGGTIVHFVPAELGKNGLYETDFVLEDGGAHAGAGLEFIDHIALGLANDQLDTWILFGRAVLGLQPGDSLELADPFGLIRSCGVANAARSLRLVLNVSLSQRTRTARTVSASGGASVHHIALASDDVFASVARLRGNGVRFVPISANYYDDLPTRVDLDAALLDRLREHGVLFDRSPAGDYFHIYSESFADRFFFEIVQRVGSYDAYGALNAPARMAAQEQAGGG